MCIRCCWQLLGHVRRHPCGNSAVRECQIRPSPCSRGRQTRRCKGYGGDAARCGQYAGGGLAARPGTPGEPVLADGRSYPRRRQTRRCKGYGGDAARYGQYAGGGLAASVGTPGEPVLADGNEVIPEVGKRGDAKVTAAMPRAAGSMPAGAWRPASARRASRCWRMETKLSPGMAAMRSASRA